MCLAQRSKTFDFRHWSVHSVILNESTDCLHICLSFSSRKMGILLLTYLTVGGQRIMRPWGLRTVYRLQTPPGAQCIGCLSRIHRPIALFRPRECLIDISRHKPGTSGLQFTLRECTGGFFSLSITARFPSLVLAFTNSMIWPKSNDFLQCKSQATAI